jgi:MSHA biogenesis protein MshQ
VDSTASDCVVGSSSNTLSSGKYGCNIGNNVSPYFGRFIPDHFITAITAACSSFTYAGQPLGLTVTAQNAGNATTQNYSGSTWAKAVTVSDAGSGPAAYACASGPSCTGARTWTNATVAASTFTNGEANPAMPARPVFSYQNTASGAASAYAMAAPYTLAVRALDTDTVTSSGFTEGSTTIRSGRVRMRNAYGSERLSTGLSVPVAFEYYDAPSVATAGWRTGTDTCTSVATSQFAHVFPVDARNGLAACRTAGGSVAAKPTPNLGLVQPVGTVTGWVDLTMNLGVSAAGSTCTAANAATGYSGAATTAAAPWLQYPWGGSVSTNPTARATFGVYRSPLIYRRENY